MENFLIGLGIVIPIICTIIAATWYISGWISSVDSKLETLIPLVDRVVEIEKKLAVMEWQDDAIVKLRDDYNEVKFCLSSAGLDAPVPPPGGL